MSAELPLVTCICPTRNRTRFLDRAVACFLKQDYPRKQLFIFEEESKSLSSGTLPNEIFYRWSLDLLHTSIGAKRNDMCGLVTGDLIAHWDDDDWHAPNRLSTQINKMRVEGSRLCGADRLVFYNPSIERAYLFQTVRKPWLAGGTLVYEKSLWKEQAFLEVSNGEDVDFVDVSHRRGVKISIVEDPSLYVAVLHSANTTTREIDAQWGHFDVEQVRTWMRGSDARA